MAKYSEPFNVLARSDSDTYRLTLNYPTCELSESVCKEWYRRSFQHFQAELASFMNPKSMGAAKVAARALIKYLKRKESQNTPITATDDDTTVEEFARDMFTDGAGQIKRWIEKGYELKLQTISQHRRNLVNYLLPEFGGTPMKKIYQAKVEDSLVKQELSNSSRNAILYTLKLIMQEAKRGHHRHGCGV